MNYLYIILLILIIFIIIYIIKNIYNIVKISNENFEEYSKYPLVKQSKIPNIIYTYWHDENIPPFINKCINSWKKYNPTYNIIILNKNNISKYISIDIYNLKFAKTQQQIADFIRIYILAQNGGIWLDATIYLNASLDWIHSYQVNENSEFVGFKINGTCKYKGTLPAPIVENWFLSCIPNSQFIKDWKDMFFSINNYNSIDDYVSFITKTTDLKGIDAPNYLTMHIACQYILQNFKKNYTLSLLEAEKGPFLYLNTINWDNIYLLPILLYFKGKESLIVKYRGPERKFIDTFKLYHLF